MGEERVFWNYDDGKIRIDPKAMISFINDRGYWVYYQQKAPDGYIFVKVTNNIIKAVDTRAIKKETLDFVEEKNSSIVYNMLSERVKYWAPSFLNSLPEIKPDFLKDTETTSFIATPQCVYVITKSGVRVRMYKDMGNTVVWESQITTRPFKYTEVKEDFDFNVFLKLVGGSNFKSLMCDIGYLMHSYRDPSNARAVFLYDTNISQFDGMPEGGSGKSLIIEALKNIKEVAIVPADRVDFKRAFLFQELSESTQIAWVDELPKGFDVSKFFSRITNGLPIEKKGKDVTFIEPEDTPKFVFTSNYKPVGSSGSHKRRRLDFGVTSFFSVDHTPKKEFGRNFFTSWEEEDWNQFFSLYVNCLVKYLDEGNSFYDDSKEVYLTLISETTFDFTEYWISDGWLNELKRVGSLNGRELYLRFVEHYDVNTLKYTLKRFYMDVKKMFAALNINVNFAGKGEAKTINV